MADPQVNLLGVDLYAAGYIDNLPKITEKKTLGGNKLIINNNSITCHNIDNFFSVNNPRSIFSGISYHFQPLQILNSDGIEIWYGLITDIDRNDYEAKIESENILTKYLNNKIVYASAAYETPAEAVENVLDAYNFTNYNPRAIQDSIIYQNDNAVSLKCSIVLTDNMTLINFIDKMAVYGCANCYLHNNELYYAAWKPFVGGASIHITIDDIIDKVQVSCSINDIINQYSIGYIGDGGTPASDSLTAGIGMISRQFYNEHSLAELRTGSTDNQIYFETLAAAQFIGEQYIKRTNYNLYIRPQPLTKIEFQLDYNFNQYIDLQTYFYLTWAPENWTDKLFEVFEFSRDENKKELKIIAYEVIE